MQSKVIFGASLIVACLALSIPGDAFPVTAGLQDNPTELSGKDPAAGVPAQGQGYFSFPKLKIPKIPIKKVPVPVKPSKVPVPVKPSKVPIPVKTKVPVPPVKTKVPVPPPAIKPKTPTAPGVKTTGSTVKDAVVKGTVTTAIGAVGTIGATVAGHEIVKAIDAAQKAGEPKPVEPAPVVKPEPEVQPEVEPAAEA